MPGDVDEALVRLLSPRVTEAMTVGSKKGKGLSGRPSQLASHINDTLLASQTALRPHDDGSRREEKGKQERVTRRRSFEGARDSEKGRETRGKRARKERKGREERTK